METDVSGDAEQHLLTGAYVLDALDDGERAAFEQHMQGCASCRAEVKELRATATLLGVAAAERPPASLKERVLAEVDRTRQDPVVAPDAVAPSDNVVGLPRRGTARILQVAAAVLAVVAVGLGGWGLQAHQRAGRLHDQIAALNGVLTAPDAQVLRGALQGTGSVSGEATVVVSKRFGMAAFVGADLGRLPSNRTYELWYINAAGKARPAGLVDVGSNGKATQLLHGTVNDASVVGLTVEPSGGSQQPTTSPVLAVAF